MLYPLPCQNVNNLELLNDLETAESKIKDMLNNQNINKYTMKLINTNDVLRNPCAYFNSDEIQTLVGKKKECNILLHLNVKSRDKHIEELLAFNKTIGDSSKEERPPQSQLWMEQYLISLKYWSI